MWEQQEEYDDITFVEEEEVTQEDTGYEETPKTNPVNPLSGLKHQDPLSLESFFLDELTREIGYETDEDAIIEVLPSVKEPKVPHMRRSDLYFDEVVPKMSDEEFRNNFRVSRATLACMVDILGTSREGAYNVVTAPRERQLLLTLFYLGSTVSFRQIAEQFNMTISGAYEFIDEVVELLANMKEIFIRLPAGHQMLSTMNAFRESCGVNGVLGVVSDCHIPIRKPMHDPDSFANWRGFFSVHLLTVSDAADRITDVCVGWPGGMHEAEVLDSSPLGAQMSNEEVRENYIPGDCFLVGGDTLPLRPWLMTPYQASRLPPGDVRKHHYNSRMTATNEVGRRAIGVMKARFRRLGFVDTKSIKKAVMLVCASCVLHNMCLSLDDRWGEELVEEEEEEAAERAPGASLSAPGSHRRRNRLIEELWEQGVRE